MKTDFFAAVVKDNYLYFSSWNMNAILKMDIETGEIIYIGSVCAEVKEKQLHYSSYLYNDKILFIPALGDYIAVLNLCDMSVSAIPLPKRNRICTTVKFVDVFRYKNELWMIPSGYDALISLNLETEEIKEYDNWPEGVEWENENTRLFMTGTLIDNFICLLPRDSDKFVTFDIENKTIKKWEWDYPYFSFNGMVYHQNHIWFFPRADYPYIVKYSVLNKQKELIELKGDFGENSNNYSCAMIVGDKIVRAPYQANEWLILDMNTNVIERKKYDLCDNIGGQDLLLDKLTPYKNGLLATSGFCGIGKLISYDLETVTDVSFEINNEETIKKLISKLSKSYYYSFDEKLISLRDYTNLISLMEKDYSKVVYSKGEKIYSKVVE